MAVFILSALGIAAYVFLLPSGDTSNETAEWQPRIVTPQYTETAFFDDENSVERFIREEGMNARVPLNEGEIIVSILNENFDGLTESQFIAFRNLTEIESPIYITFIDFDFESMSYVRTWTAQTAAASPGTVNLYTLDLLGDRSTCVLVSGLNYQGEHTLTVFQKTPGSAENNEPFTRIAEIRIDGSIIVREFERSQAYRMGVNTGQSFNISAFGRDTESENILDQLEIVYAFNRGSGLYEVLRSSRIPGAQVEQQRVRELLGNPRAFEDFLSGLWHFVTAQGNINRDRYVYFDPVNREVLFSDNDSQQIFRWQNSTVMRYGLYVTGQNTSISTLRRGMEIELESLESIRVRVVEDLRPLFWGNTIWDGSYRKASPLEHDTQTYRVSRNAFVDAHYDSPIGRIRFYPDGSLEISVEGESRQGRYAFFNLGEGAFGESFEGYFLETRIHYSSETYYVRGELPGNLSLSRVRIGTSGIEDLGSLPILLTITSE